MEKKEKKKSKRKKKAFRVGQRRVETRLCPLKHLHEGSPLWYSDSMIISAFFFAKQCIVKERN